MKSIKLSITGLLLVVSVAFGFSQGRGLSVEDMAKQQTTEIKSEIKDLTENQLSKLYDINLKYAKKISELKSSGNRSQLKSKKDTLQTEKNKELKAILSADQYKIYTILESEQQQNKGRR